MSALVWKDISKVLQQEILSQGKVYQSVSLLEKEKLIDSIIAKLTREYSSKVIGKENVEKWLQEGTKKSYLAEEFEKEVENCDPYDLSLSALAIQLLSKVVCHSKSTTMMEMLNEMKSASVELETLACNHPKLECIPLDSLRAGCNLFSLNVTKQFLELKDFSIIQKRMEMKGKELAKLSDDSRKKIARHFHRFLSNQSVVLVIGYNKTVVECLLYAQKKKKQFQVYVTENRPRGLGYKVINELNKANIPTTLIVDSAVAHLMHKFDFVLTSADMVTENGGIISSIGTYQAALVARAHQKLFYVLAESFKFVRQYPVNQRDLKGNISYFNIPEFKPLNGHHLNDSVNVLNPICDFTPPAFIDLIFTDLGVRTQEGVSDEFLQTFGEAGSRKKI